jgi:PleD family two-component response regulator
LTTVSVGVATFNEPPKSLDAMLERVDRLLYIVKKGGKDRVVFEDDPGIEDG